jgi:hypothetical protein
VRVSLRMRGLECRSAQVLAGLGYSSIAAKEVVVS